MKALLCRQFGDPDTLAVEEVESRAPAGGEVRLRVRAAGINFTDVVMIQGQYQLKPPFPFSPGLEVAGEVIDVGEGVNHLKPGDPVIALTSYGGLAEELCVPAMMVLPRQPGLDAVVAAGLPVSYGTAHVALDHRGKLQPGETLLVLGAAGGTGLAAVQVGKLMGAMVIAAASTDEKLQTAQKEGADYLINYSTDNLRERVREITGGKGVNVVYDPVGGALFEPALRSLAWEGRLLVIGFASGTIPQAPANLTLVKNCAVVGVFWGAYSLNNPKVLIDSLRTLLGWQAAGKLTPHVSQTFPLRDAPEAIWTLMRRQAVGKIVVTMD